MKTPQRFATVLTGLLRAVGLTLLLTSCDSRETDGASPPPASPEAAVNLPSEEAIASETVRFNAWVDQITLENLARFNPQLLTSLGRSERNDTLNDFSAAKLLEEAAWRDEKGAEMPAAFSYDLLSPDAQLTWDILVYDRATNKRVGAFERNEYVFTHRGGPHTDLPSFLMNTHPVRTESDMLAWISRLNQIGRAVTQALERARAAAEQGVHAPYFVYEGVLRSAGLVIAGQPFEAGESLSPLYRDGSAKLAALREANQIDAARESELKETIRIALTDSLLPAYQELMAWAESELELVGNTAKGAGSLPDGPAYYAARLAAMTTTDMSAEEIHALGLAEVARIHAAMETLKNQAGFAGSLTEFFGSAGRDSRFFYPNTDAGREAYIAQAEGYLRAMEEKLPQWFGRLPKAKLEVRRYPPLRERPGQTPSYTRGAPDGSRPAFFNVSLVDMSQNSSMGLAGIAYHEGVPGHHLQFSLAQETEGLPLVRQLLSFQAYSEGWGLYAELLAVEMGGYSDPYSRFGQMIGELFRAIRLVVDTGIHAMGWSEQQALDYALANSSATEGTMRDEIRRYFVTPGQATSYSIGLKKIQDLRARSEAALGEDFDIRAFHDQILGGGAMPLSLLERRIDHWLAEQQAL